MRHILTLALVAAVTASAAACGGGDDQVGGQGGDELTVLAAASLTDVLPELGRLYRRDHGVRLTFSFAGSQQIAAQVRGGAPADLAVTADRETMRSLAGFTGKPRVIARNELAIAVPAGNPERVRSLADLAREDLTVVLAAPEVPAGRYAREALSRAHVVVQPASEEPNVRAVLSRVQLGEADAGIVYASDVRAAGGEVEAVPIPHRYSVPVAYPAAVVTAPGQDAADRDRADAFLAWLDTEEARDVFVRHGFEVP